MILSTYRQPEWLRKSLWGYACQTRRDFELVVADDGSGPETERVVEEAREEVPLRIRHVWQEDRGFRKCRILNRAILATEAEYLIFSDGDCVPRNDFVATHLRLARPGRFLGGGLLHLPLRTSERIGREEVESGRAHRLGWLVRHGWRPGHRVLRLTRSRALAAFLDAVTPTRSSFNGCNASAWRGDALAVNGFEEEMGYRGEDREFGDRLTHLGRRCVQVRHRAVLVHLAHDRPYATEEAARRNDRIRERTKSERRVRARTGLDELQAELTAGESEGRDREEGRAG